MASGARIGLRRLIGFDFGTKRIGAAVGQEATHSATPLCTFATIRGEPDWQKIGQIVAEWQPDRLVVGHPLHADGTRGGVARAAERFAAQLAERLGLPVDTVDERLSSHEAELRLRADGSPPRRSRPKLDAMAACLILETWFSSRASDDENSRPQCA